MTAIFAQLGRQVPADEIGWPRGGEPKAVSNDGYGESRGMEPSAPYVSGAFNRQETIDWLPSRSSADGTILRNRDLTLQRVRDLLRNDPTAGAALQRLADLIVGPGLRLSATPDARALGITPDAAREFGRKIQAEWRLFGEDPQRGCDANRRLTINGIFRLLARTHLSAGEACGLLTWRDDPSMRYSTCVMTIDPDRISNPYQTIDTMTLRGGVEMDSFGAPIAYHVRNAHAGDWWAWGKAWTWTRVERRTKWGRPVFFHGFEPEREGQTRGVSPFASLVARLKMLDKFAETELASAVANALFAAFVETDLPPDEVAQRLAPSATVAAGPRGAYIDEVVDHYTKNPAMLGGVRIPVMLPGSKITMNSTPRQTTAFPAFERVFVNRMANRLGLPGELLTDFSQTNYSSARAALNEMWRTVQRMSAVFAEQVAVPIYHAFLEEAFEKGYLTPPPGAPAFHDMPGAYLRARWIGPGRGYVDPVKEATASNLRMDSLTSTLEAECVEQGLDMEETIEQIAYEKGLLDQFGLSRVSAATAARPAAPEPDGDEDEDEPKPADRKAQNRDDQ